MEVSLFAIGVTKIIHELGDCLSEIDFVPVELINQQVHQLVITEIVAQQVLEVDEEGLLLLYLYFLCLLYVVLNGRAFLLLAICVDLEVWILIAQLKARKKLALLKGITCEGS